MAKKRIKEDPWRVELDRKVGAITFCVQKWVKPWLKAEEADEVIEAAGKLRVGKARAAIDSCLAAIEAWHAKSHDDAIRDACAEFDRDPDEYLIGEPSPWLRQQCSEELSSLQSALSDFAAVASSTAAFVEAHSGLGGFLADALGGYVNPIEGIAALFGKDSTTQEGRDLDRQMEAAFEDIGDAIDLLVAAIDAAVVERWNDETVEALTQITEQASDEDSAPEGAERKTEAVE